MSSAKEVYLTEEGLEKIKEELNYLKLEKRPEIVQALKDARALGDLSENAEYDAARGDQAIVEARILELEQMVEKAVIIKEVNKDVVSIGTRVTIEYVDDSELEEYSIVGSKEADPFLKGHAYFHTESYHTESSTSENLRPRQQEYTRKDHRCRK